MASPGYQQTLTALLKEKQPSIDRLRKKRDYFAAKALRETTEKLAGEVQVKCRETAASKHITEARRLDMAQALAMKQVNQECEKQLHDIEAQWQEKMRVLEERHSDTLNWTETTLRSREESRPIVLSSYVRDLQRSEKRLADLNQYDESEMARRKVALREVEELGKIMEEKEFRVKRVLDHKASKLSSDRSFLRTKMKNEMQLAMFRAERERKRVETKFNNIRNDMQHVHSLEMVQNSAVQKYKYPKFIHVKQPEQSAANRGTQYFHKTLGSKFDIPSLCDLYGEQVGSSALTPKDKRKRSVVLPELNKTM